MKEIGGYIELDAYSGKEYHSKAVALNCGRNALIYLIQIKQIQTIYMPYFICSSVTDACKKYGVQLKYYHIDLDFRPILKEMLESNAWLYLVNYYGQINDSEILDYKQQYDRIIIDNAQAFFRTPVHNVDTLYTCRKFFGVPDGAYLYTDTIGDELEQDYSYERMHFLLGRFEKDANEFYAEYAENNQSFRNEPVKSMSKLTHNLLRAVDYKHIADARTQNFTTLHRILGDKNKLNLNTPYGAFMYPLYLENGTEIRKQLQNKKIYIPTLWPDVFDICTESEVEYRMAENILPLPIDQRYNEAEMSCIVEKIAEVI